MTLYGVYAGTLDVNGMPILDIQNGSVLLNGTTSDTTALYTAGQKKLDAQKAAAAASSKKTTTTSGSKSTASSKKSTAVHLPARRLARWCGSPPMAARSTTATPTAAE